MFHNDLFGENVFIFSPSDDQEQIKSAIRHIDSQQRAGHFTTNRYALFFKPGVYNNIEMNVGFFTHVAGLGLRPTDTKLKRIQCTALWNPNGDKNEGLANFWRMVENMEITDDVLWAVSQASPMRRIKLDKNLFLHENDGYTSGGFLADSMIDGIADHGSQQQWLTRNSSVDSIKTYGWNQVFMGTEFKHSPQGEWPEIPVTVLDTVPKMREKPFLIYDDTKGYGIFVPALRHNSRGVSWADDTGEKDIPGRFIPVADCYVAKPETDSSAAINAALDQGKHLILTPGIYHLTEALHVSRADTVILGLGLATLLAGQGNECLITDDAPGIIIAGILFDAGPVASDNLLVIGNKKGSALQGDTPPVLLSDIFFRIGGFPAPEPSRVKNCLEINSNHVIGDNLWIWRADHSHQVGWNKNTADSGIIVNGSDVTMYALMVEHFLKYQTIWNGERGRIFMYQSEMPYDAPSQEAWMSHNGAKNGCASLKVADSVNSFESWCVGVYSYHRDAPVICHSAVEVPDAKDVVLHNTFNLHLNGYVGISHVINEAGAAVSRENRAIKLVKYCNGEYIEG